jgi:exodeoxyribonuclease VII small subunit
MAKKKLKYSEAVQELDAILKDIEDESVDVDVLAEKVKRATELISFCRNTLKSTEVEVKKVLSEFDADVNVPAEDEVVEDEVEEVVDEDEDDDKLF